MFRLARQMSSALLLLGVAPSSLSPAGPFPSMERAGVLVTVAEVTPDRATLWVRADTNQPVRVRYGPAHDPDALRHADVALDSGRDQTGRAVLDTLTPGTRYAYEVRQEDARVRGTFVTAPLPDADAPVRLVWSGDLGGSGYCRDVEDGYRIFRAMARRQPDLFLFVGDTVYADQVCGARPHAPGADYVASTLAEFHGKHRYNRADPVLQEFFRSTGVFAIWDDHEVRNNFAGGSEPLMAVGLQALLDYWPIQGPPEEPRRLYRAFRWGRHVETFILDTRQYRSANADPDGPEKTMLGAAQRAWLLRGLAASDATWKLVVTSVPLGMFTGGRYSDSWSSANLFGFARATPTGYAHERDAILRVHPRARHPERGVRVRRRPSRRAAPARAVARLHGARVRRGSAGGPPGLSALPRSFAQLALAGLARLHAELRRAGPRRLSAAGVRPRRVRHRALVAPRRLRQRSRPALSARAAGAARRLPRVRGA